jgi:hypothetical protein
VEEEAVHQGDHMLPVNKELLFDLGFLGDRYLNKQNFKRKLKKNIICKIIKNDFR